MLPNPYESPRPLPGEIGVRTLKDSRWSLSLTGFFAGGYVGAWVGSLGGAAAGVLFALLTGVSALGYRGPPGGAINIMESVVSSGVVLAILGALAGGGLGATLGLVMGTLVAASGDLLRKGFVWLSCLSASLAATSLAAAMFRFEMAGQEWRHVAVGQDEWVARVAAICLLGLVAFLGGGLLGRILREVAWEPGAQIGVVEETAAPRME